MAEWTFPQDPDDALVDTAIPENSTETLSAVGTSPLTFTTTGASTLSARATSWQNGAGTKYWSLKINTIGYRHITVSVKLRSSSTGPRDFALQYRTTPEGAWQDVAGGTILVADNFTSGFLEALPLPEATENQEALFLRLVMASNQSVNGGTVTSSGSTRLDDLLIIATLPEDETPELGAHCTGDDALVRLNELLPYPSVHDQEYAELFNSGDQCVDLSGWRFEDSGGHRYIFPTDSIIESQSYHTVVQNLFLNNTTFDTLTLYNQSNEEISRAEYARAIKGLSYSFQDPLFLFTSHLTPGEANIFDALDEEEAEEAGSGIRLNEIFPNPLTAEGNNEFIELYNLDEETKDLKNWSLIDASQKIFTFEEETLIPEKGFLTIPRSVFGFSLNNSGTETVSLVEPQGNILSEVSYAGAQENFSYSFNGSEWQWSKKVTPGTQNEFSKNPLLTLTEGENGYVDIPLIFKLEVKNAKRPYKYTWDFGDGHRSTMPEPKHTFPKPGKYKASVILSSESGITKHNFTIEIKKYPKAPVLITRLMANPEGKDVDKEWVEIKNTSRKAVNLTGWKLATGSEEPINHPFLQEIVLTPNQTLQLTRRHAAFSLPNTKGVVELHYPNDEIASSTYYNEESIEETAICTNENSLCDFKNPLTLKKKSSNKEKETSGEEKAVESTGEDTEETVVAEPPALPTKKEILKRIGGDFNLLMNQIFLESF